MSCDAAQPFESLSAQGHPVRYRDLRREKLLLPLKRNQRKKKKKRKRRRKKRP